MKYTVRHTVTIKVIITLVVWIENVKPHEIRYQDADIICLKYGQKLYKIWEKIQ